jgi:hypothetical protein
VVEGVVAVRVVRLVLVSVALVLAGCGQVARAAPVGSAAPEVRSAADVDCGTFTLGQGERLPESVVRCFIDAVGAGSSADLKVTRPTIEGDPIPMSFHADPDGQILVITDSRQDRFGNQVVTHAVCYLDPSATAERASGWPEAVLTNCS